MTRSTPKEDVGREHGAPDGDGAPEGDGAARAGAPTSAEAPAGTEAPDAPDASEASAGNGAADAAEAEAQPEPEPDPLTEAQAERDEYLELAQRTQADFENYRKRAAKDMAAAGARAKTGLVRELLPVVDNLERALTLAPDADEGLSDGVRLVLSDLQGVLARAGVEALDPAGAQFDPTVHEALSTRTEDGAKPGMVLEVVEKGYRMNDSVIRPARVVVSA